MLEKLSKEKGCQVEGASPVVLAYLFLNLGSGNFDPCLSPLGRPLKMALISLMTLADHADDSMVL